MAKMKMYIHEIRDAKIGWGDTLANPVFLDADGNLIPAQVVKEESNLNLDWRKRIVGHPVWRKTTGVLGQAGRSVGGYLRAQVSLALVMFLILTAGLSLLGVHAPAAWGCLTALADLLPLVGAGVVLLPWAGFALLTHRTGLGIGLAVLWLLLWFLRQWLEPRLVGRALGVHPYVMLAGLYAAYRLGGVGGMILAAAALGGVGGGGEVGGKK